VVESIKALRGEGRADLMEVTLALANEMLLSAGLATDRIDARARLDVALASGAALDRFRLLVQEQGGDPRVVDDPALLPRAPVVREVRAVEDGIVPALPPRILGEAIVAMGGGRRTAADQVDPAVGYSELPLAGAGVNRGDTLVLIHAANEPDADQAEAAFRRAWDDGLAAGEMLPPVLERITRTGTEPWGGAQ